MQIVNMITCSLGLMTRSGFCSGLPPLERVTEEAAAFLNDENWHSLFDDDGEDGDLLSPTATDLEVTDQGSEEGGLRVAADIPLIIHDPLAPVIVAPVVRRGKGVKRPRGDDRGASGTDDVSPQMMTEEEQRIAEWNALAVERGLSDHDRALAISILKIGPSAKVLAYIAGKREAAVERSQPQGGSSGSISAAAAEAGPKLIRFVLKSTPLRRTALELLAEDPDISGSDFVAAMRKRHRREQERPIKKARLNLLGWAQAPSFLHNTLMSNHAMFPGDLRGLLNRLVKAYEANGEKGGPSRLKALVADWIQYCVRPLLAKESPAPCTEVTLASGAKGWKLSFAKMKELFRDTIAIDNSLAGTGASGEE